MTDFELLEYAANAAGIEVVAVVADGIPHRFGGGYWNPLTDDGDALRLAVKLGIDLEWRRDGRVAAFKHVASHGHWYTAIESSREDRSANTRRAIVRVAAEIGGSKP